LQAGTLDIATVGAVGTGAIIFAGKATLKIENAAFSGHVFANPIDFFAKHDVLDLPGLKYHVGAISKYHPASDLLTVHSGHFTDTFTLLSPAGTHFATVKDGHGGTKVTLAPPHAAATMASLSPQDAAGTVASLSTHGFAEQHWATDFAAGSDVAEQHWATDFAGNAHHPSDFLFVA
jgi:hypothetical protein